jgi:hypothetical protein
LVIAQFSFIASPHRFAASTTGALPHQTPGHQRAADLQALVDASRGDVPLIKRRFRCSNCGSRLTDWVVTAKKPGRWNPC